MLQILKTIQGFRTKMICENLFVLSMYNLFMAWCDTTPFFEDACCELCCNSCTDKECTHPTTDIRHCIICNIIPWLWCKERLLQMKNNRLRE